MISFITEVVLDNPRIHFAVARMETQKRGGGLLSPLSPIVLYIPQKCEKMNFHLPLWPKINALPQVSPLFSSSALLIHSFETFSAPPPLGNRGASEKKWAGPLWSEGHFDWRKYLGEAPPGEWFIIFRRRSTVWLSPKKSWNYWKEVKKKFGKII